MRFLPEICPSVKTIDRTSLGHVKPLAVHNMRTTAQKKFIVVAVDYFIKWIEAKALTTITGRKMFVMPPLIIMDIGTQFQGKFKSFCTDLHILTALKKKALQTTPYTATGETSFSLIYGEEAVIPVEIDANQEAIRLNLDLIDELREIARVRNTACCYNNKVKSKQFQVGDLILKNTEASLPTLQ
ncbi:rve domain-containing protein [Gossypium australe]|uniref:Rve domain-containing protein n=1 Tax=Gossypium australe TaxID=47621 RepID=A0A5B6VAT0_9ROSI|nr:rve domain-containing protein [Gossypium australe]